MPYPATARGARDGEVPFIRWLLAFFILLPLAGWVLRPGSGLWPHWRRFAVLGLLGVGLYNTLQYLALHTSTPVNVTLVASSMPLWMLALGRLFFNAPVRRPQLLGALLSMLGVTVVLARGDLANLARLQLVPGDLYILAATLAWALYSWLLARPAEPAPGLAGPPIGLAENGHPEAGRLQYPAQ